MIGKRKLRREKRRKRRWRTFFLIFILLGIYIFAFKTEFFSIIDIEAVGNNITNYNDLVKASQIEKGDNIFKINIKSGKESLEKLPYIKEAKINKRFPEHIIIEVGERKEIVVVSHKESFFYIDNEGYILSIAGKDKKTELPEIFALQLEDLKIGDNVFQNIGDVNLEELILSSEKTKILPLIQYMSLSDKNNVIIETKDNIKVAFGPLNNVKYKVSFLSEILEDIKEKDISVKQIILNKGDNPIILTDEQ